MCCGCRRRERMIAYLSGGERGGAGENAVVVLRDACGEDLPAIEILLSSEEGSWHVDDVGAAIVKRDHCVRVLVCKGELQGVLLASFIADECSLLYALVHSQHRRRGLARQFLQDLQQLAVLRSAETIFLEVRESNAAAIALYRGEGFSLCGERENYYPPVSRVRQGADIQGASSVTASRRETALLFSLSVV